MKYYFFILAMVLISTYSPHVMAEDLLDVPMTLRDCLRYARSHAYANRMSKLDTECTAADKRICASDLMPYIGIGSNGNVSFGRNIDPETNTYDNKKTLGTGFGLEISLPIFDGLVRINNLKAFGIAEQRKLKSQLVEQDRISLEVIKAFYNISFCKAMVSQMEGQLRRDSADLKASLRLYGKGSKSRADVAELEAIVAADRYELINQRNILRKARLTLCFIMGMDISDSTIEIIDEEEKEWKNTDIRQLP